MSAPAELGVLDSGFLLDGQWVCEGRCVEVRRPAQGHVVGRVWWATAEHLQHAIEAAVRTFAQTRRMPSWERRAILERVADRIAATREDWARLIGLDAVRRGPLGNRAAIPGRACGRYHPVQFPAQLGGA